MEGVRELMGGRCGLYKVIASSRGRASSVLKGGTVLYMQQRWGLLCDAMEVN